MILYLSVYDLYESNAFYKNYTDKNKHLDLDASVENSWLWCNFVALRCTVHLCYVHIQAYFHFKDAYYEKRSFLGERSIVSKILHNDT